MEGLFGSSSWNEHRVNNLARTNRRASQVPAAAVILTPRVFVHSAAVKKFVVGPMSWATVWAWASAVVYAPFFLLFFFLSPSSLLGEGFLREREGRGVSWLFWGSCSGIAGFLLILFPLWASPVYCEEMRVFKAGYIAVNTIAWNNRIGPWLLFCWFRGARQWLIGMVRGIYTASIEVKFLDWRKINCCESVCQRHFHWSRTKVRGSKTIRYRRSLYYKR